MDNARIRKSKTPGRELHTVATGDVVNVIAAFTGNKVVLCIRTYSCTYQVEVPALAISEAFGLLHGLVPKPEYETLQQRRARYRSRKSSHRKR